LLAAGRNSFKSPQQEQVKDYQNEVK